jgi:AAA domain/UvrD-like helicase C-terminal domain
MTAIRTNVAFSQDFFTNLLNLPPAVHSKVMKWAIRFQADPTSSSINYEKIRSARDKNLRSVRIDQDWRGVVFRSPDENVFVLMYVDHHDAAYRWAEGRKMEINPVTGAMQVVLVEERTEAPAPQNTPSAVTGNAAGTPGFYDFVSNRELLSIGVPEDLIPRVRSLQTEGDLDRIQGILPLEAYEGLFLLAAGDTVSQILQSRETRVDQVINTNDFAAALDKAETQSRFFVVDNDEELAAVLNSPLAQWRVFLHPTQRKLAVGNRTGAVRVLGGAGTGKTVLAMHRAKWLAENATADGQKVLFTTFTKNLAVDILENLRTICGTDVLKKIEVVNLDAWVYGFLRGQRYEHRIVYGRKEEALDAWQRALTLAQSSLGLDERFYEQEWEEVILGQGIVTRDEYRSAKRSGRGVVLTRAKRDAVWTVFEEYRAQLASRKLKEVDDAYRDAAALIGKGAEGGAYSAIVVDETQDFSSQALRLLRAIVPVGPNDLFFVGDGHQRIYKKNRAAMSRCGIDIRGRSRKLYLNYRTTEEIRKAAVALLENCTIDDLDDGNDESRKYKSLSSGPAPTIEVLPSLEAVLARSGELLDDVIHGKLQDGYSACVIAPNRSLRDQVRKHLQSLGAATHTIEANEKDSHDSSKLRFATMHRAKGLEFDQVLVIAQKTAMEGEDADHNRKLAYVALTRAKMVAALLQF